MINRVVVALPYLSSVSERKLQFYQCNAFCEIDLCKRSLHRKQANLDKKIYLMEIGFDGSNISMKKSKTGSFGVLFGKRKIELVMKIYFVRLVISLHIYLRSIRIVAT